MATDIEWADETWNPTVGCSRVDHRCDGCYAMGFTHRGLRPEHAELTKLRAKGSSRPGVDWTGVVRALPGRLSVPLRWRKAKRIFVDSLSDLFHPAIPFDFIAAVYGVMQATPRHTYLVLTKRPARAREFFEWIDGGHEPPQTIAWQHACLDHIGVANWPNDDEHPSWPPRNVQLGVSVSDQPTWDRDVPEILQCPAALHFVSAEPLLGPIDVSRALWPTCWHWAAGFNSPEEAIAAGEYAERKPQALVAAPAHFIRWIVVGGESGHRARTNVLDWTRSIIGQCRDAGVPVFHKQIGERALDAAARVHEWPLGPAEWNVGRTLFRPTLSKRKGGEMADWPADLRVRELPEVRS